MKRLPLKFIIITWLISSILGAYLKIAFPKNNVAVFLLGVAVVSWLLILASIIFQLFNQNIKSQKFNKNM
jgi:hypothetical protein